jgi:phosphoglucosamine mutase
MKYFGTDGIRDKAENILQKKYGYYLGKALKRFKKNQKTIFIARDTRAYGQEIVNDIKKGLYESGIDVYDLGVFPTPVLAYFSFVKKTYGIMVTASHNPYHDNGIKVFNKGIKLEAEYEHMIEEVIDQTFEVKKSDKEGQEKKFKEPLKKYMSLYQGLLNKVDLRICLDLANGAAVSTAEEVFRHITDDLILMGNAPDGRNINQNCGSTHLEALQKAVIDNECDLGIAFDGDADRLLVVDHQGNICDGDLIIYLFASYLKAHKELKNKFVALSKMCNIGIVNALNAKGIDVIQTNVGDKYIVKAIEENDGVLGGENSGHIINKKLFITGDGVLNAAFLIHVLDYYKVPLADLSHQVTYYPDLLINIRNIDKSLATHPKMLDKVNHFKRLLGGDGKILVRPSGTEPLIRISVSAPTERQVNQISNELKKLLESLNKGEE